MRKVFPACVLLAIFPIGFAAGGEDFSILIKQPSADRWMYPANGTPGTRAQASTFSALPNDTETDNRFGQFIFRFDTAAAGIPAGLGAENYDISAITVTATIGQDRLFRYDPTQDAWTTYGMAAAPDGDLGRPLELHGTGFRNGFTSASFQENSAFSGGSPAQRNAYALGFDGNGFPRDVTDNVSDAFESRPWAVGQILGLAPGDLVPEDTIVRFTLDPTLPGVAAYIRNGLNAGAIWFTLSSLHPAIQQGGEFVSYLTRDSAVHMVFGDAAPALALTASIVPPAFRTFSISSAGMVTLAFPGLPGFTYTLQASPDLTPSSWVNVQTFPAPLAAADFTWQGAPNPPRRFFRISRSPATP